MKNFFSFSILSTKIGMLLCVSGLGIFGFIQASVAASPSPCHQEIENVAADPKPSCDVCETALESLEQRVVFNTEITELEKTALVVFSDQILENFDRQKPLMGIYQAYYPPPQVGLKAVTPITKTIILLI